MSGLQNRVMEEQVIDWIAERAQHTEEAVVQDAIRQPGGSPDARAFAGAGLIGTSRNGQPTKA